MTSFPLDQGLVIGGKYLFLKSDEPKCLASFVILGTDINSLSQLPYMCAQKKEEYLIIIKTSATKSSISCLSLPSSFRLHDLFFSTCAGMLCWLIRQKLCGLIPWPPFASQPSSEDTLNFFTFKGHMMIVYAILILLNFICTSGRYVISSSNLVNLGILNQTRKLILPISQGSS